MKKFSELTLGYSDAENYKRAENKDLFNRVFIRNQNLERLCERSISFLVGEKGAGKTAYALYLANNDYKNHSGRLRFIRETDYQKFIALKQGGQIAVSDYTAIWKVILLLLLSQQIIEREGAPGFFNRFSRFKFLKDAIEEYYNGAFSPEINQALEFVQEANAAAEVLSKHLKGSLGEKETLRFSTSRVQLNLFYIQRAFETALEQLRLDHNHLLFIDGIDVRPASIPYVEYIECIKGLANAVWSLNNDVFPALKSKGRVRVVLLVRPDIFGSLGLQNLNTKSRENSVFLDWRTDYKNFRQSDLFRVIDHLLASQQSAKLDAGAAWDYYFPWQAPDVLEEMRGFTSFLSFLRYSYYRPRDVIAMLKILQDIEKENGEADHILPKERFDSAVFKRRYSEYLAGEIRDQLTFYYSIEEYELFLKFFTFLRGHGKFSFQQFVHSFENFAREALVPGMRVPSFMLNARVFLQFLYDLNVICYIDETESDGQYIRWCFRERSYGNLSPKVSEGSNYRVFVALQKALNLGQKIIPPYQVGRPVRKRYGRRNS